MGPSVKIEVEPPGLEGQGAAAGNPPPPVVAGVDLRKERGGITMQQETPSGESSDDVEPQIKLEGSVTSRSTMVKANLLLGFALLNPTCTTVFTAGSPSHAVYTSLTSLGVAVSLILSYKGDGNLKKQEPLLMVSTMALLGSLILGVGASVHAIEFF